MAKNHAQKHLVPWILGFTSLWIAFYLLRPWTYTPWCAVIPTPCLPERVNSLDQIAFAHQSIFLDFLSNIEQNAIVVFMLVLPWIILKKAKSKALLASLFLILGTTANGALLELVHTLSQRPRPLVFRNPLGDGSNIHQYNSFYSGHTSFTAMATFCTFLWIGRFAPEQKKLKITALIAYFGLTATIGALRVLSGRHYPTDVLIGWIAGTLIGYAVFTFFIRDEAVEASPL